MAIEHGTDWACPVCLGDACDACGGLRTAEGYERTQAAIQAELDHEADELLAHLLIAVLTQEPPPQQERRSAVVRFERACAIARDELRGE